MSLQRTVLRHIQPWSIVLLITPILIAGDLHASCAKAFKRFRYVNSIEDFRAHQENHVRRVGIMGQEVLQAFPERYRDVDPVLLAEFLLLHDQAKLNQTEAFLKKYGLDSRDIPLLEELFSIYGNGPQLERRMQIQVKIMNTVETEVALEFFRRNGLVDKDGKPNAIARQYLEIEKIADIVDTVLSPVRAEEFGVPKQNIFDLRLQANSPLWEVALHLDEYYQARVKDPGDHLFL